MKHFVFFPFLILSSCAARVPLGFPTSFFKSFPVVVDPPPHPPPPLGRQQWSESYCICTLRHGTKPPSTLSKYYSRRIKLPAFCWTRFRQPPCIFDMTHFKGYFKQRTPMPSSRPGTGELRTAREKTRQTGLSTDTVSPH